MAQADSCRPVTLDVRVQSQAISCGICGRQRGIGTGFSPNTSVARCQYNFHQCAVFINSSIADGI